MGQFLFCDFDDKIGFTKTIFEHLQLKDGAPFVSIKMNNSLAKKSTN